MEPRLRQDAGGWSGGGEAGCWWVVRSQEEGKLDAGGWLESRTQVGNMQVRGLEGVRKAAQDVSAISKECSSTQEMLCNQLTRVLRIISCC